MITLLPNQYFGLGDVIFTQTLVRRIAESHGPDTRIIWGVMPHFVEGLNRAYPSIQFIDWRTLQIDYERKDDYEFEHPTYGRCRVLPLRWSDALLKMPYATCMRAKYDLYGLDYKTWRDEAMWRTTTEKRSGLFQRKAGGFGGVYSFGNTVFGSECKLRVQIPECDVNMSVVEGYSLFDWATIIQKATEIHTVNTSILFLIDMLELKASEVHVYQRGNGQGTDGVSYLFTKHKYVYHD